MEDQRVEWVVHRIRERDAEYRAVLTLLHKAMINGHSFKVEFDVSERAYSLVGDRFEFEFPAVPPGTAVGDVGE